MKSKLLQTTRLVAYLRNFQTFAHRDYSSKVSPLGATTPNMSEDKPEPKVMEREVYLLGPKDRRAPLPGDVGVGQTFLNPYMFYPEPKSDSNVTELLEGSLPEDRQRNILEHFLSIGEHEMPILLPASTHSLELAAQTCPWLVKRDLADLFPDRNLIFEDLTVITVCHKTNNDMSSWDEDTDAEREELTQLFIGAANQICQVLKDTGYWADFIDPSSGRPYLGAYTNATFYETDERYRYFGLKIEDLGCCKVISHHLWGTNAFVGCIFTNAPLTSKQVASLSSKTE